MIEGLPARQAHRYYGKALGICIPTNKPRIKAPGKQVESAPDLDSYKEEALGRLIEKAASILRGDGELKTRVTDLEARLAQLEAREPSSCGSFGTFITSLGDARVSVKKPIPVTLRSEGEEVVASFLDANISAGGDTVPEAIGNLQSLTADIFLDIKDQDDNTLGKSMKKQKHVLLEVLCLT